MAKTETWIVVPDLHVPFACEKYLKLIDKLIKKLKPNGGIIQLGDALDCFQVSKYLKDPSRKNRLYQDIQAYKSILENWLKLLPNGSTVHQLEGNHEYRLTRWIWERCPELVEMFVDMPAALGLPELNKKVTHKVLWHPMNKWDSCKVGNTVFFHGVFFNKHVASGNVDRYMCNSVSGHTHRVQYACNGTWWAWSLGHGSDESQTSHNPVPTGWQQAIGIYTVVNGKGSMEVVQVKNGIAIFRGEQL